MSVFCVCVECVFGVESEAEYFRIFDCVEECIVDFE